MTVDHKSSACTVIVTVDGLKDDIIAVLNHASQGLEVFANFDGFVAGATHLSDNGRRIVQYLQWDSKDSHEYCMKDPLWEDLDSGKMFMQLMRAGAIQVDVQTFEVVNSKN